MKSAVGLAGLISLAACAGESFGVAEGGAAAQGGSAFPPLDTTSGGPAGSGGGGGRDATAGAGGSSAGDAGAGGASGDAGAGGTAPTLSACGELRGSAGDDELEVCIEAGTFSMGDSDVGVPATYNRHDPAHEVTLAAYVLDAYEVTVGRYRACMEASACTLPVSTAGQGCTFTTDAGSSELLPVTCVTWDQAYQFCAWDDNRRLPTEAEWERAARSTDARDYAWGDDQTCLKAVFGGAACSDSLQAPKAVGSAPTGVSAEGAFDLTGNAWEWVNDWYAPYAAGEVSDPTGPNSGSLRMQRGGHWATSMPNSRAFMRRAVSPGAGAPSASFRCARDAASP